MNFISSCNVQPYQISEKRSYVCIAQIKMHKIKSIMSSAAIPINIKLARYIRLALKKINMFI